MARIGIIGTGWGVRSQLPAFREAGLIVSALAGHDGEKTRSAAAELNVKPFDDWRRLVEWPDVDLVSITAPPSEHLAMATAALDAGKHVLCEKPTAVNADEARQMVDAAKRHAEAIALIDHELRFVPAFRAARERIADLGAIRYIEVRYSSPNRGDRTRAWNWWSDAARGGGVWGAVGSHFVDAIRYFGGEFVSVQATMHTFIDSRSDRQVTSDDFAAVSARLRSGALATMTFSAVAAVDEPSTMTIHGSDGAFRLSGEKLLFAKRGGAFEPLIDQEMEKRAGNSMGGAFGTGTLLLGKALRAAIDDGDRAALSFAATFEDGLEQQRVLDAARAAAKSGAWVDV